MLFVVNPRAAGGEVGRRWPVIEPRLRRLVDEMKVVQTTGPLSATGHIRDALERGELAVCVVGGDGTVNEAVNAFIEGDSPLSPEAELTIIPVGSGTDYAKTVELPIGLDHAERVLQADKARLVDVGKATYVNVRGATETRYFANILQAGVGGSVVDKVNRSSKLLGGRIAFLWAIITTLPGYENQFVEVEIDGQVAASGPMNSVIIANGRYYGSGLKPAPMAELDDGLFEVVLIGDVGLGESLSSLGKLRKGDHLEHPKVSHFRGKRVIATSPGEVLAEMDGELVGKLPMEVEILPRHLRIRVLR